MESQEVIRQFTESPETLYNEYGELTLPEIRELIALEERIVALSPAAALTDLAATSMEEGELARLADELLAGGGRIADLSPADQHALLGAVRARTLMNLESPASDPLPVSLAAAVERVLGVQAQGEPRRAPALIVELAREGLRAVKSALQGVSLDAAVGVQVRNAATAEQGEKIVRMEFSQTVALRGDRRAVIRYEALRESDDAMTLVVRLADVNAWRVELRRDGRIVESRSASDGQVRFERLTRGDYDLDFSGGVVHQATLFVRD
jgi:hypothetical protein